MKDLIAGIIQLIILLLTNFFESNTALKKKKVKLTEDLKDALKEADVSAVNSVIGRINRLRK